MYIFWNSFVVTVSNYFTYSGKRLVSYLPYTSPSANGMIWKNKVLENWKRSWKSPGKVQEFHHPQGVGTLTRSQWVKAVAWTNPDQDISGLVQDCSNSIANTLDLLQSCTKPLIYNTIRRHYVYIGFKECITIVILRRKWNKYNIEKNILKNCCQRFRKLKSKHRQGTPLVTLSRHGVSVDPSTVCSTPTDKPYFVSSAHVSHVIFVEISNFRYETETITLTSHDYQGISNHQQLDCLSNSLLRLISKRTSYQSSILLALYEGNPPVTSGFHSQRAVMHFHVMVLCIFISEICTRLW